MEWVSEVRGPRRRVGCRTAQALRQILRLPDERLRFPSYGGPAGARGLCRDRRPEDADLIILNTCHIREKAAEKVYSELGRMRVMKQEAAREGRRVTVAVAGCVAQAEGAEIIRRAPVVDLVVGPQSYHRLPELLARETRNGRSRPSFPVEDKFGFLARAEQGRDARARRHGVRHRAGRLRQVLHLLRRALHARRRGLAPGREDPRRSRATSPTPACAR